MTLRGLTRHYWGAKVGMLDIRYYEQERVVYPLKGIAEPGGSKKPDRIEHLLRVNASILVQTT